MASENQIDNIAQLWSTDAPEGKSWKCPDCDHEATLGGNAAFHSTKTGHGLPSLVNFIPPSPWQSSGRLEETARIDALEKALREVLQVASNDPPHDYLGGCPDEIEGLERRDKKCPACIILLRAEKVLRSES